MSSIPALAPPALTAPAAGPVMAAVDLDVFGLDAAGTLGFVVSVGGVRTRRLLRSCGR